jgi:hypothetical protein
MGHGAGKYESLYLSVLHQTVKVRCVACGRHDRMTQGANGDLSSDFPVHQGRCRSGKGLNPSRSLRPNSIGLEAIMVNPRISTLDADAAQRTLWLLGWATND